MRLNNIKQQNTLRIIAGRWRGRKLPIIDIDGLRPTPDRVRETLFNWLQMELGGARCLDLFSGSGALGFEAASRGAEKVTMVENNTQVAEQLRANCQTLATTDCLVVNKTAQQFLTAHSEQYDVVFIDPPYQANLWQEIAQLLVDENSLAENATIYLECPRKGDLPVVPECWQLIKDKQAGGVRYCLFVNKRSGETE